MNVRETHRNDPMLMGALETIEATGECALTHVTSELLAYGYVREDKGVLKLTRAGRRLLRDARC